MVDIEALENEMKAQDKSDKDVANALKVDLSTWYRRKSAPQHFKIGEIVILKDFLHLSKSQATSIFLP